MLDELKLKVDNTNKRLLLNAFFYKERRGNIDGLYTLVWDDATSSKISDTVIVFNDELRDIAKSSDASKKAAFDDYYIKNITIRRDGGFLVVSEALSSTSRGNTFNRWDRWGRRRPPCRVERSPMTSVLPGRSAATLPAARSIAAAKRGAAKCRSLFRRNRNPGPSAGSSTAWVKHPR